LPLIENRAEVEEILRLAGHLNAAEHSLMMAVYNDGMPLVRLSRLLGNKDRGTVARRVRRALARLANPNFGKVLLKPAHWSPLRQAVAERIWLFGDSQRKTARELGLTLHGVRRHAQAITAWLNEDGKRSPEISAMSHAEIDLDAGEASRCLNR